MILPIKFSKKLNTVFNTSRILTDSCCPKILAFIVLNIDSRVKLEIAILKSDYRILFLLIK